MSINIRLVGRVPSRASQKEVTVAGCLRNEMLRLPYFLQYYRSLGVNRFILVDNESTDGSRELLESQPDVFLFSTSDSYAESLCGVHWINHVLHKYCCDAWCLTVDIDELLVYPQCEALGLPRLVEYLDSRGHNALNTFMLDMYSDKPLIGSLYKQGTPFLDACRYHDPYNFIEHDKDGLPVRGGVRHRLFWENKSRPKPSPVLKKIPLVRWHEKMKYLASTHKISNVTSTDITGVLLHFKFFHDFSDRVASEAQRGEHWDNSAQYHSYAYTMTENPGLYAFHEQSVCYQDSSSLVELGMMKTSASYELFFSEAGENPC